MISVHMSIECIGNYVKLLCSQCSDHNDIIYEIEYMLVYIQQKYKGVTGAENFNILS